MPTTFEKTWQVDVNRPHLGATSSVIDQTRSLAWYMKAFLTGQIGGATQGLATVVGSSDGVTAGMDSVDRWGAVYDGTKIGRAMAAFNAGPATPSATGGSLASGTYRFLVVPVSDNGMLGPPNNTEFSAVVTGPTGSVTVGWNPVAGATGYRIYVTPPNGAAGSENVYYTAGNVASFVVTGTGSTPGTPAAPGSASPHSWIWLRLQPFTAGAIVNTSFYFCIDLAPTADNQFTLTFSKAAPAGGTIYVRATPAPVDEWTGLGVTSNTNTIQTPKLNGWLSTDGNFLFCTVVPGSGIAAVAVMFQVLQDARPADPSKGFTGDLYPAATFFGYLNSGVGALSNISLGSTNGTLNWQCRARDGSAIHSGNMIYVRGTNMDPPVNFVNTGDASDGAWIELPSYFGSMSWSPASTYTIRGRFVDLVIAAPGAQGNGGVEPIGGPPVSQVLGYIWVPLTGVPVTL